MGLTSQDEFDKIRQEKAALKAGTGFQIFIKDTDGATKTIVISRGESIKSLKSKVEGKTSIEGKWLQFGGKNLDKDNLTIDDYGIQKESTLSLLGRMEGGAILPRERSEKDALKVQGEIKQKLKNDLVKKFKNLKDQEAVNVIIDNASDLKKGVFYSEESLSYYINNAKKRNETIGGLLKEIEGLVKLLINIVDESDHGKFLRKKHKESDVTETIKRIKSIVFEFSEFCKRELTKEMKDLTVIMGTIIDKAKNYDYNDDAMNFSHALSAFKSWPYYTLDTPYLILCKSKDLPLLEVYEIENLAGEKNQDELEPAKNVIKSFYLGVHSVVTALSFLVKDAGNVNSYYLKVVKELNSGVKVPDLDVLKSAMSATANNFSNEKLKEMCLVLGKLPDPVKELQDFKKMLSGTVASLGKLGTGVFSANPDDPINKKLGFAAVMEVFNSAKDIKAALDKIDISNQYWMKQLGNVKNSLNSISVMKDELERRVLIFTQIQVLFLTKQPEPSSTEDSLTYDYSSIQSLMDNVPFIYSNLKSELYKDIISKIHNWRYSEYEINPNNFESFFDRYVEKKMLKELNKVGKFYIKKKELINTEIAQKDYPKDKFLEKMNEDIWRSIEAELMKDVEQKSHSFVKIPCGPEFKKYTTKDKNKKNAMALSVEELVQEQKLMQENFVSYNDLINMNCKNVFSLPNFKSVIKHMEIWKEAKNINLLKNDTTFKSVIFSDYNIVALTSDIDKMSGVSDKLRISLLNMGKLGQIRDAQNQTEKEIEDLVNVRKYAKLALSSLELALGIGAGVTTVLFPPAAPILAGVLGVVKLIDLGIESKINGAINKKEEHLLMGDFIVEINRCNEIIQEFQATLSSYMDDLFNIWALKPIIIQKLDAKK